MVPVEAANDGSSAKANHDDSTFYHDEHHGSRPDAQFDASSHDLETGDLKEATVDAPSLDVAEEGEYVVTAKTWAVVVVRKLVSSTNEMHC